jgi:hypothetical protein
LLSFLSSVVHLRVESILGSVVTGRRAHQSIKGFLRRPTGENLKAFCKLVTFFRCKIRNDLEPIK